MNDIYTVKNANIAENKSMFLLRLEKFVHIVEASGIRKKQDFIDKNEASEGKLIYLLI